MIHLLRVTAFNLPRLTRLTGVVAALLMSAIHAWLFARAPGPTYLSVLFLLACAGGLVAAVALLAGFRSLGWRLAILVASLCLIGYLVSRGAGLPDFAAGVGAWHNALGTVSMLIEAILLAVYASIRVGFNVDVVGARDWNTYFSQ